jgi:hypothetical protein
VRRAGKGKTLYVTKNEGARSEEVVMQVAARGAIRGLPGRMEPPCSNHRAGAHSPPGGSHGWSSAAVADEHGRIGGSFRGLQTVFCSWRRGSGLV